MGEPADAAGDAARGGEALLQRARARIESADPAGAIEAFDQAVELRPNDPALRLEYGLALEAIGELDDAAYQLLQGEKRAPDDPRLSRALGTVFYKKGLYDKAVRFLGRATKLAPNDARAFFSLGVVHDARHDPGAAIAALREAIRLDP